MDSLLLSPIQVGSRVLRNRVVFSAHGAFLSFYQPGESPDRYIAYQERRAAGGAGLIVLQPVHVHPSSHALGHHLPEPGDLRAKLAAMARALHRHGTAVLLQLIHFGAEFRSDVSLHPLWSFSGGISPSGSEASHAMSEAEIEEVIDGYVQMAQIAVQAGLDGIEIHAAHGYLVHQSLSPWGNRRTDRWGEPLRFLDTIVEGIRGTVGSDPLLGVRLSADDYRGPQIGGLGPDGLAAIAGRLAGRAGIDYLGHSAGSRSAHYARAVADFHHPPGNLLELTAGLHRALEGKLPLVGVGKITDPLMAERILAEQTCELVAMTRAQIADPDVVAKYAGGQAQRIRPCVGANAGCVDRMVGGLPITCFHNPAVGRERELPAGSAPTPRRVLVVGGGPAGLAAAHAAAGRGHQVALVERLPQLGGRLESVRGPARRLLDAVRWRERELARLEVGIALGRAVDEALLAGHGAELIILATGATPAPESLAAGDGSLPVIGVEAAIAQPPGGRLLIADHLGTEDAPMCAEVLAAAGAEVLLCTPMATLGAHIGFTRISATLRRLAAAGVRLEPSTVLAGVRGGEAVTRNLYTGLEQGRRFDGIVAAVHGRPDLSLLEAAQSTGATVEVVGDARAPRRALQAFREGEEAGLAA